MSPDLFVLRFSALYLAGIIGYCFVLRRFADFVQPYRLRMAKLGTKILDEHPSATREARITFYLDNAFNGWVMAYAMLVFPFAAVWGLVKYACSGFSHPEKPEGEDTTMMFLFALSSFAANPLCGTIFTAEWIIFAFVVVVLGGQGALMSALSEFIRVETALSRPSKKRHAAAAFQ